ncbi:fumarate hydratase, partial [Candidatus Aerophobetes bacterium]
MRKELLKKISSSVSALCMQANYGVREDIFEALCRIEKEEKEDLPKFILSTLVENIKIAQEEKIAVCQDTG